MVLYKLYLDAQGLFFSSSKLLSSKGNELVFESVGFEMLWKYVFKIPCVCLTVFGRIMSSEHPSVMESAESWFCIWYVMSQ